MSVAHTVIVPAKNEVQSLDELYARLVPALDGLGGEWEIVFVDDGSTDGSGDKMQALSSADPRLRVIRFPRNFGKSAAYRAAFAAARGDLVFTMDADLQDDPAEFSQMKAKIAEGYDLVIGWKVGRFANEPLKRVPSFFFNGMMSRSFGLRLKDANCGLRVMKRVVADSLVLYGDLYRFIPQLAFTSGFRVAEVPVKHHARKYDRSKYGPLRFWTGFLDLVTVRFLTRYHEKPLHFFATAGLVPGLVGVGLELYVLGTKLALGDTFQSHVAAIVIGVMAMLVGVQLGAIGLVGELIAAQIHHVRHARERSGD